jgi:hypothetical protein
VGCAPVNAATVVWDCVVWVGSWHLRKQFNGRRSLVLSLDIHGKLLYCHAMLCGVMQQAMGTYTTLVMVMSHNLIVPIVTMLCCAVPC